MDFFFLNLRSRKFDGQVLPIQKKKKMLSLEKMNFLLRNIENSNDKNLEKKLKKYLLIISGEPENNSSIVIFRTSYTRWKSLNVSSIGQLSI